MLTPRRVALAAAEALAEGLLGLPVKEKLVSRGSRRRAVSKTKISASASLSHTSVLGGGRHCRLSVSSSVRSRVRVVEVVASRKAEIAKVRNSLQTTVPQSRQAQSWQSLRHQHSRPSE